MTRLSRALVSLGCLGAVGLLFALPDVARSQQHASSLTSFQGTFLLAGARDRQHGMIAAIDRVADQMNIFVREIARGELRRRIAPEARIHIAIDELAVAPSFDGWVPGRIPLDGRMRELRGPAGEALRHSVRFEEGRLIERRVAAQGERVNVLTLSPDERNLHMDVRISSSQLPDTIRYRLSYRRAGG